MTESLDPPKTSKAELEQLIKANGGKIYQTNTAAPDTICIADRSKSAAILDCLTVVASSNPLVGTVKVASAQKSGKDSIIRARWLFDCIKQNEVDAGLPDFLIPLEPR
jgi:DNA ligase-4